MSRKDHFELNTPDDQSVNDFLFLSKGISERIEQFSKSCDFSVRTLIFTHRQSDPDALCSAWGINLLLGKCYPKLKFDVRVIAPQGPSVLGSNVCARLGLDYHEEISEEEVKNAHLIFAVDIGQPNLLGPYFHSVAISKAQKFLVDHHSGSIDVESTEVFDEVVRDTDATSTCEVIVRRSSSAYLDQRLSEILLTGILFDSQHLGIATTQTLESVLKLMKNGASIELARSVLKSHPSRSELIARIKSAQRMKYSEIGPFFVIRSEVSSFHASVARMMIEIGGDVGIAYGKTSEGETRVSTRSTQKFFKGTGIDLGQLLKGIADTNDLALEELPSAGGHPTAASFSGRNLDPSSISKLIVEMIKSKLPQM